MRESDHVLASKVSNLIQGQDRMRSRYSQPDRHRIVVKEIVRNAEERKRWTRDF